MSLIYRKELTANLIPIHLLIIELETMKVAAQRKGATKVKVMLSHHVSPCKTGSCTFLEVLGYDK